MRHFLTVVGFVVALWATTALAGPIDSPLPTNPCPSPLGNLKLAWVATESGTNYPGTLACGSGGTCAETMVVCTNVGATGNPSIDVAVELFSAAGAAIPGIFIPGASVACGLAPGATVAFLTDSSPPPPYFGQVIGAGPQTPLGTLRIVSTVPKQVACDVTLIDLSNISFVGLVTASKDVTLTKSSKGQKGD